MPDLELVDIVIPDAGPAEGWSAVLLAGDRLAAVAEGDASSTTIGPFAIGGETEVSLLRAELAQHHPGAADPIDARCRALVAWEWLRRELAETTAEKAVAVVTDDAGSSTLVQVPVPEGGDLEGAIAHLRSSRPDALVLNGLPEDEAVAAYARTAS